MQGGGVNDNHATHARTALPIACPDCRQAGTVAWGASATRKLVVEVSSGFHAETGRTASGETLIVCDTCDTILPVDPVS